MTKNLWENFYRKTKDEDIPWRGVNENFFKRVWGEFDLPQKGKILDVGCGTGDKTLYFAENGFEVWGFDVSETAVKRAKAKANGLESKPKFLKQNATDISNEVSLSGVKLDIVFDILCTQFLKREEKLVYLEGLSKYIKPGETFYVLVNFAKETNPPKDQPSWVQEVAMSKKEVEEAYGKYFRAIDRTSHSEQKGTVDRYILKARSGLL